MRRMLLITVVALLPLHALAGPKEDGQAVFDGFLKDFNALNADAVASHFADDALFWGTAARDLITTPAAIHQYFATTFNGFAKAGGTVKASPVGPPSVVALSDDAVVISDMWQVEIAANGTTTIRQFRNSMTIVRRGDQWRIVSFHNSPRPPAP